MPSPTTDAEFLELVRKSGVVEDKRLDTYLDKLRAESALPPEPPRLAGVLVRDGLLTHFQAEQFLLGKWRRFTIGKYKVLERLGAGGMGSVYLCEHKLMRRRVAVKVLPTAKADDPAALERFYREARAVAALDHPNIVRAYDADQDDKLHFLVMEHVDGSSLQEIVKKTGPLTLGRAAHYILQSALGLQHAHETAGLVHRDIKPGNILVDRNGTVKVLDMGLALFFHDQEDLLTKKYDENVLGTADYLAPEQALDSHAVDIRADIYSLGATFYFCLTGRTPFNEGSVAQKLIWHQTRQPKALKTIRADVPDGLVAVIEKMMAKDPGQRYQDPAAVVEALAPWTREPISPPDVAEMPRLSPAAMAPGSAAVPANLGPKTPVSGNGSSRRKVWQVAGGPEASPSSAATPSAPAPPETRTAPGARSSSLRTLNPTIVVPAAAPQATLAESNTPVIVEVESPSWEKLAGDTQEITGRADTSRTSNRRKTRSAVTARVRRKSSLELPEFLRKPLWWAVGAGTLLLLIMLVVLLRPSPVPSPVANSGPQPLRVNPTTGPYRSLKQALLKAHDDDHILIEANLSESDVTTEGVNARRLTIEGPADRQVTWRRGSRATANLTLLRLVKAEGFVLQNLTLDGGGMTRDLLAVWGDSPGLRLHRLNLRGFTDHGVFLTSAEGTSDRPIEMSALQFETTHKDQVALFFGAGIGAAVTKCRFLSIHGCEATPPGSRVRMAEAGLVGDVAADPDWAPTFVPPPAGP